MNFLPIFTLCTGAWMVLNGLLHDIAILLSERGKTYDRELLRLLMDGHILLTCGVIQMISWSGLRAHEHWAFYTAGSAAISLLIYCVLIFPFLKSIFTMLLNGVLVVLLIVHF